MSRVVITGASGGAPTRLEINTFVKNDKFFSLYIQALQVIYSSSQDADPQSFFQIAGIHGLPYQPWNGATGSAPFDPNAQWGGYCIHGSVLFPTWHRPYVMLFEQTIQQKAKTIAATYTVDKAAWQQAADQLRQPYWDWARNAVPPPEVISLAQVSITGPNGAKKSVPNPFLHYTFHPIPPSFSSPYNHWTTTHRQPTGTGSNPTDSVTRLTAVLRNAQPTITSATYSMLTRVRTWPAFSSHTVGDGGSSSNSIEAIHDNIHVYVGGNGHMSDPAVAAFDPIFFLHHCNVDRLLSLWAAINPGVWVVPGDSENGSFTLPAEVPVNVTTPLTPFWNTNTTFWPSSTTQDTTKLGYTYPEFAGLNLSDPAAVKTAIGRIVNTLYASSTLQGPTSAVSLAAIPTSLPAVVPTESEKPAPAAAQPAAAPASDVQHPVSIQAQTSVKPTTPHSHEPPVHVSVDQGPDSGFWDWTARIHFKKYELNSSFYVFLFLGQVPEDPEQWLVSPNLAGSHTAFVNSTAGHCANCRQNAGLVEEGFVHLDNAIIKHAHLTNLDPSVVEPYLTENLHWRVQKVDGTPADLESLEVMVVCTPLTYPPGAMFPVPGESRHHHGITHGKRGGSRQQ